MMYHDEAVHADVGARDIARFSLLDYNRGDVDATLRIRDWLTAGGAHWPMVAT